ncbi:hypothetical protein DRW07_10270 [Alteromonas sediminis]|uniref:Uncharacterized protein n=1 Tax=Alteromonas sediminis TaxID=2259342 RepID=A0A3N5YMB1_9ALTE|nr:hypothetical protein [Alteromonas sediminis]RPJ66471.1 hypothetical protein DRW07_10270 [Alteromonas sediminis]
MENWLSQTNYIMMFIQIFITLVVVPIFTFRHFSHQTQQCRAHLEDVDSVEVKQFQSKAAMMYWTSVGFAFGFTMIIVLTAFVKKTELLNWDNQTGLMLLFLIAMVPLLVIMGLHKKLLNLYKEKAGGKRYAALDNNSWKTYLSRPLLALVGVANITYTASVVYFSQHPFEGFAGYYNLLGQLILNAFFAAILYVIYRDNKSVNFSLPEHKERFKKRAMKINLLVLALALFQITLMMWVQGSGLIEYKLIIQSLYFQLVLVLTAITFKLPDAIFQQQAMAE